MKNKPDGSFFNRQFCVGAPQNCYDRSAKIAYAIFARGRSKGRSDMEEKMKLVIGGYAQGKLRCVLQDIGPENARVWDGDLHREAEGSAEEKIPEETEDSGGKTTVINHFHLWVKDRLEQGGCPEEEIRPVLEKRPDCVIISDEIGNGIVPMERTEREYRERTGRILVELAARADEVERILCGIRQKIR